MEGLLELSRPGCGSERGPVDLAELCEEVAGKVRITAGDQACAIARGGADESGELAEDWPRALEG